MVGVAPRSGQYLGLHILIFILKTMRKNSEIRKMTVLGKEWDIEIDYRKSDPEVNVYSEDCEVSVQLVTPYELLIIANRLSDIAEELEREERICQK